MNAIAMTIVAGFAVCAHAAEPAWPTKPIKLITPFTAGSVSDVAGRLVAQRVGTQVGQTIVIDNHSGASGTLGVEAAARAVPDGYTLLLGTTTTHAVSPGLAAHPSYDPVKDFTAISLIGSAPYVLAVPMTLKAANVKELVALAKSKPKELNYASAGIASLAHLATELFAQRTGTEFTHVPYKSSALSVTDLINGRIDMQFATIAPTRPHIRAGKLRALAVSGLQRVSVLPDVPTMEEAGVPGYDATLWLGIFGPAKMAPQLAARLSKEIATAVASPEVKEGLSAQGVEAASDTPEHFAAYVKAELEKWKKAGEAAGIKPE